MTNWEFEGVKGRKILYSKTLGPLGMDGARSCAKDMLNRNLQFDIVRFFETGKRDTPFTEARE